MHAFRLLHIGIVPFKVVLADCDGACLQTLQLRMLRQVNHGFKASLGFIVRNLS